MVWNSNRGSSLRPTRYHNKFASYFAVWDPLRISLDWSAPTSVGPKRCGFLPKTYQGWNYARRSCWISGWNSNTLAQMWWFWFGRINLTIASSSKSLRITQDCSSIQLGVIGWLQLHFWQPCHLCKRRSIHTRITQNASEITRWDSIWVRKLFFLCTVITWSLPDGFRMVHSQKIIVLCHPCPTVTISNCYCFIPYLRGNE